MYEQHLLEMAPTRKTLMSPFFLSSASNWCDVVFPCLVSQIVHMFCLDSCLVWSTKCQYRS
uniref:Uncharacterized protein n=1 Tax=Solanum lycopersicum TaxID=4081 RepID=A0A3Q7G2X9_SOLLC